MYIVDQTLSYEYQKDFIRFFVKDAFILSENLLLCDPPYLI